MTSLHNIKYLQGGYMSLINISKIQIFFLILTSSLLILYSSAAFSHSGNTNQDGCHVNTFTGKYHCHAPKPRPFQSANWCISGGGCGYSSQASCEQAARSIRNAYCYLR